MITQSESLHTDLPSEIIWEVALTAFHRVQSIQRKTAKLRGSPFLCWLEFPSCLWKWIKFMSSMKQSKSSSSSLARETLYLFFLQFSSARTAFIRYIHRMHFLSRRRKIRTKLFFPITIAKYPKYCGESLFFFLACRHFPGVRGTYQHISSSNHVTLSYTNAFFCHVLFPLCLPPATPSIILEITSTLHIPTILFLPAIVCPER